MKFYYVYILLCSDKTYYTGMTNDLERRINQHKSGYRKDGYTFFEKTYRT
ncbi:GIY-YIG nuclease family protein [Flavivirga algicola]|nr:GIY-YIG nuclease family protein [Flavivirga algicola]